MNMDVPKFDVNVQKPVLAVVLHPSHFGIRVQRVFVTPEIHIGCPHHSSYH